MAERRRLRPGRLLVVVVLVLLLALLLELNRFLPGAWPGGGGPRGVRPVATGTKPAPDRVVAGPPVPPAPSRDRVVAVVVTPPARGAGPAGTRDGAPEGTEVRWGSGRGVRAAGAAPAAPIEVPVAPGFDLLEVRTGDVHVFHGAPPAGLDAAVRVALPAADPGPRPTPGTGRDVVVRDDRGPIAGADVHGVAGGKEFVGRTDAAGSLRLPRGASALVRVCASSADHGEACVYANLDVPGALDLAIVRRAPVRTAFVAPGSGNALRPSTLRLRPRGAPPRALARDEGFGALETSLPTDLVATGRLEIEVPGRPPVSVPLATLGPRTEIPEGRALTVTVRDARGAPVEGARVEARWSADAAAEPEDAVRLTTGAATDAAGTATLRVPTDRDVALVTEADGVAPAVTRVARDAPARSDVTVAPAARVRVRVLDAEGRAAPVARVVVVVRVGDEVVRRQTVTDGDGTATVAGLPAGRVDVHAHVPGHAWGAVAVAAVGGDEVPAEVRLARGHRLHVVVEDPDGVPIPGVAVRSVERPDAAAGSPPPPADPDRGAWVTDSNGTLSVDDLPGRALDLFLHRDGFADEAVADVTPGPTILYATLVPKRP